jgi:hypothetical protein
MSIPSLAIPKLSTLPILLSFVLGAVVPLRAEDDRGKDRDINFTVLYEGPLTHDQDWIIKSGPISSDNQKFRAFGGTCSMVPADVSNRSGSGRERVTFEAENRGLGVWKMAWTDTVSGRATDGNSYKYQQRYEYVGTTTDGKAPRPSRAAPSSEADGFLQPVPSNVIADALDLSDIFLLHMHDGGVVASSHVHWTLRLQIDPAAMDPSPSFFPVVLYGGYIVNFHDQLAGQLGCDPL